MTTAALAAGTFALAAVLVYAVRRYALHARVLDVPNARSSHLRPTPRGGGLGLVAALVLVAAGAGASAPGEARASAAVLAATLAPIVAVALAGWIDDRRSLPVRPRLATHVLAGAAVGALAVAGARPGAWASAAAGAVLFAWWTFWAVSAINVVNFMDGIDGLIASQLALFGAHLAAAAPEASFARTFAVVLAAASAGFLVWNWAPARIFLGDVGSGALGLAAVAGGLLARRSGGPSFLDTFLPLAPLFADAALTMVRRARRGERLSTPHRSHLYQRLANGGWGHAYVSVLYAAAAGLAVLVVRLPVRGPLGGAMLRAGYLAAVLGVGLWLDRRVGGGDRAPS